VHQLCCLLGLAGSQGGNQAAVRFELLFGGDVALGVGQQKMKAADFVEQVDEDVRGTAVSCDLSDRYVEDASFLRFRAVTFRYNLSSDLAKKLSIKSASIYITAENILTFTKYTGQDPEVGNNNVTGPFTVLTDNSTTPPVKAFTLGLTVSF